jgi:hypothetical protein
VSDSQLSTPTCARVEISGSAAIPFIVLQQISLAVYSFSNRSAWIEETKEDVTHPYQKYASGLQAKTHGAWSY